VGAQRPVVCKRNCPKTNGNQLGIFQARVQRRWSAVGLSQHSLRRFPRLHKVTVMEISGGRVKLGFDVDSDVPVHRLEVWERVFGNGRLDSPNHDAAAPIT
jgi:hypothetical protein